MDPIERKKIASLEKQLISNKPWQLKGEISGRSRPLNSLLFEDVKFEQQEKAPVITSETTEKLEEMIKRRIKDSQFNDPIKKVKPASSFLATKQVEVSSEKSKIGLAQIYEQQIIAKASTGQVKDGPEKEVENKLFSLFRKLDALVDR